MKKSLFLFMFVMVCSSLAHAQTQTATFSNAPGAIPVFKWLTDSTFVLGQVEQNKPVTVSFEFINSGKAPLVISRVEPSCGCTAVDYSKAPVYPNQKGFIKTTYNAASIGVFAKNITVFANTADLRKVLMIKGEVVKK